MHSARFRAIAAAIVIGAAVLGATACQPSPRDHGRVGASTVILVSLDGFRWDFRDLASTPALDAMAARGVTAERLIPPFPSMTFPSHYTMATGLYPEHHGIVSNAMYDPSWDAWFRITDQRAAEEPRWWEGEPIWLTAERQGVKAATFYWPGTDVAIDGRRPTYWRRFDPSIRNTVRVDQVLEWLALPEGERPGLITLYFGEVDRAAHDYPIGAPQLAATIERVDAALERLWSGLERMDRTASVNIIVVSDHGHAPRSPERVIFIDDYIDLRRVLVVDWNPVWMARVRRDNVESVYRTLSGAHPNLTVFRKDEIPDRFHFQAHRRIPDIVALADEGWSITTREYFSQGRGSFTGNTHGYDNALPSMGGLFIATGPAFRSGVTVPAFESVHLYELVSHLLGITPGPNDGNLDAVRSLLSTHTRR